ncbi:MAG: PHP domain-containing protein [Planctomycetes bacterium]|nr:PHP domain-containing protein [Planctomycetota bacterium]
MTDHAAAIARLNHPDRASRLAAAAEVGSALRSGALKRALSDEVNCHVHTKYSFSPYYPAMAAWKAIDARLLAVGIIDHDSVSGCDEMLDAGARLGIAATAGFEMRVSFAGTRVAGRKLNNPDSEDIGYIAIHGLPRRSFAAAKSFLAPMFAARNQRNRRMVERINALLAPLGIAPLDFERDVWAISQAGEQGSITERHLLYALSLRLAQASGGGQALLALLTGRLGVPVPAKLAALLIDPANPHATYDLLGVLKSSFLERVFIQPGGDECVPVAQAVAFGVQAGAIPVYAYLGDVGESPTGDKKAELFEDSFLDLLVEEVVRLGFKGITYMPPRNTSAQLARLQALCRAHRLFEISGVDINSSRQAFTCPIILEPQFRHLVDATWALFAHERLANHDLALSLFDARNPLASRSLDERVAAYAAIGKRIDPWRPDEVAHLLPR